MAILTGLLVEPRAIFEQVAAAGTRQQTAINRVSEVLLTDGEGYRRRIDAIDFHIERLHVSPAGMREVGQLIRSGRIWVHLDTRSQVDPRGAGAVYTPHFNRMTIRADSLAQPPSDLWRATIVHESIHALVDLRHYHTTELVDETAAYIAEAIYTRAGGIAIVPTEPDARRILMAAHDVVTAHQLHIVRGVQLQPSHYAALQAAILAHTIYRGADTRQTSGLGIAGNGP